MDLCSHPESQQRYPPLSHIFAQQCRIFAQQNFLYFCLTVFLVFLLNSISSLFSALSLVLTLLDASLAARVGGMMERTTS